MMIREYSSADVPAMLFGRPSLGRGIGEVLTPVSSRLKADLLGKLDLLAADVETVIAEEPRILADY